MNTVQVQYFFGPEMRLGVMRNVRQTFPHALTRDQRSKRQILNLFMMFNLIKFDFKPKTFSLRLCEFALWPDALNYKLFCRQSFAPNSGCCRDKEYTNKPRDNLCSKDILGAWFRKGHAFWKGHGIVFV